MKVKIQASADRPSQPHYPEDDNHQRDRKLQPTGDAFGNCNFKRQNNRAHDDKRSRVPCAPECPDDSRAHQLFMLADDGRDCHEMISLRGMLKPVDKAKPEEPQLANRSERRRRTSSLETKDNASHQGEE